jgi:hypothetical protein
MCGPIVVMDGVERIFFKRELEGQKAPTEKALNKFRKDYRQPEFHSRNKKGNKENETPDL